MSETDQKPEVVVETNADATNTTNISASTTDNPPTNMIDATSQDVPPETTPKRSPFEPVLLPKYGIGNGASILARVRLPRTGLAATVPPVIPDGLQGVPPSNMIGVPPGLSSSGLIGIPPGVSAKQLALQSLLSSSRGTVDPLGPGSEFGSDNDNVKGARVIASPFQVGLRPKDASRRIPVRVRVQVEDEKVETATEDDSALSTASKPGKNRTKNKNKRNRKKKKSGLAAEVGAEDNEEDNEVEQTSAPSKENQVKENVEADEAAAPKEQVKEQKSGSIHSFESEVKAEAPKDETT